MFIIESVITEQCNLGCNYCYMNNNPLYMSKETFKVILDNLDNILNIYNQSQYHLDFFGGEPLLNFDLIEYAVPLLQHNKRCESFGIISNLLELDENKVSFIKNNNINVSFSFDGLWNEYNRPLRNGTSSLQYYEKKKDLIKMVSPSYCKTMVSPASLGTLVENARYLADVWGFSNIDYSLVRDDIWSEDDINKFKNEIRDLSNLQIELFKTGKDIMIGFYELYLLDMLLGYKNGKRPFGCFAGSRGIGILPNGIAYPCARFATNREYPIYDFNTNHLYKENFDIFTDPMVSNPRNFNKCQQCTYYIGCNAGCTYSQMKNNNNPVASICRLYDIIYTECFYVFNNLKGNKLFIERLNKRLNNLGG